MRRFHAIPALAVLIAIASVAPTATFGSDLQSLKPNYVTTMTSPIEGSMVPVTLRRAFASFPARVVVVDNAPAFSQRAFEAVMRAGWRWRDATRNVPGGGVSFVLDHGPFDASADIVVLMCTNQDMPDYGGFTDVLPNGQVLIRLRALYVDCRPVTDQDLERIAAHELGHALGIGGHSPNPSDIMSADPRATSISLADVNTLRIAYGGYFGR